MIFSTTFIILHTQNFIESSLKEMLNLLSANITKWSNTIHRQIADELFECV